MESVQTHRQIAVANATPGRHKLHLFMGKQVCKNAQPLEVLFATAVCQCCRNTHSTNVVPLGGRRGSRQPRPP